jgi:hypothetical protein
MINPLDIVDIGVLQHKIYMIGTDISCGEYSDMV